MVVVEYTSIKLTLSFKRKWVKTVFVLSHILLWNLISLVTLSTGVGLFGGEYALHILISLGNITVLIVTLLRKSEITKPLSKRKIVSFGLAMFLLVTSWLPYFGLILVIIILITGIIGRRDCIQNNKSGSELAITSIASAIISFFFSVIPS